MKRKIIKGLAVLFIFVGISLLIVPRVSNQVNKKQIRSIIEDFEKERQNYEQPENIGSSDNVISSYVPGDNQKEGSSKQAYYIDSDRLYRDSVAYNESLKIKQHDLLINENSYQQISLNLQDYGVPNNVYGYISAPSIDLELPIYLGASNYNMELGAAHLTYTSLPLGGESTNCVLAAHNGYIGKIFFDYISTLQYGDKVNVTNLWGTLTYQVMEKRIYKNYESADCYITDGKDLLTLITCAHGGADRYYVICERVAND